MKLMGTLGSVGILADDLQAAARNGGATDDAVHHNHSHPFGLMNLNARQILLTRRLWAVCRVPVFTECNSVLRLSPDHPNLLASSFLGPLPDYRGVFYRRQKSAPPAAAEEQQCDQSEEACRWLRHNCKACDFAGRQRRVVNTKVVDVAVVLSEQIGAAADIKWIRIGGTESDGNGLRVSEDTVGVVVHLTGRIANLFDRNGNMGSGICTDHRQRIVGEWKCRVVGTTLLVEKIQLVGAIFDSNFVVTGVVGSRAVAGILGEQSIVDCYSPSTAFRRPRSGGGAQLRVR
jgi:hypothetical protein